MTYKEIENSFAFLREEIKRLGLHPGEIIMRTNAIVDKISQALDISSQSAANLANLLVSNDYLIVSSPFIKLTEKGYDLTQDIEQPIPKIKFEETIPINPDQQRQDQIFYLIWDLIGGDKDNNPYYVDGKEYFDTIKPFLPGLPPSYSQYMEELLKAGESRTRSRWCKDLFLQLPKDEILPFLSKLSDKINDRIREKEAMEAETEDNIDEIMKLEMAPQPQDKQMAKTLKIFISHNTQDSAYAKALVDLLMKLGVNEEEDIFCSSVPGCGVKFGQNFIEAIRSQYENHDLIILFIHSPRLYESPVSLNEMGAGWVLRTKHYSFLSRDCEYGMLRGVIPSTEIAFKAGKPDGYHLLNEFRADIARTFNLKPKSDTRWDAIKADFIKTVEQLPVP